MPRRQPERLTPATPADTFRGADGAACGRAVGGDDATLTPSTPPTAAHTPPAPTPRRARPGAVRCAHRPAGRRWAAVAIAAVLALPTARPAFGQIVQIDEELARAVSINAAGRERIDEYVGRYTDDLLSDDRTAVVNARDALSTPLADERVSVAFRQALGTALEDELAALVSADESWRRLVGLRLAADLATERTAASIERALGSDRNEVRFFAMFAAESLFDTVARSSAAVTDQTLTRLLERAAGELSETDDPRLADAAVRTVAAAVMMPRNRVEGLGYRAVGLLADSAATMARRTDSATADGVVVLPLVRAGLVLRDFIAVNSDVPRDASVAAIGYGGDLVAFVFERSEAAPDGDEIPAIDLQLAGIGASLVFFGEQNRARADRDAPRVENVDLVTPLREDDRANFRARALGLVGESGALRRPPFRFAEGRFDRR